MTRVMGKKKILEKHIFASVGEWKIVSLKIFKWIPTFGIGPWIIVSVLNLCQKKCIRNFGFKLGHFKNLWKVFWNIDIQSELTFFIWKFELKLWPKEWLRIKLTIWFSTIKIQELGDKIKSNYDVGNVFYELYFFFWKIFNQRFYAWIMSL